jgi:hypothetical protein
MAELVVCVMVSLIRCRTGQRWPRSGAAPLPVARPLSLLGGCSGHKWSEERTASIRAPPLGQRREGEEEDLAGRILIASKFHGAILNLTANFWFFNPLAGLKIQAYSAEHLSLNRSESVIVALVELHAKSSS